VMSSQPPREALGSAEPPAAAAAAVAAVDLSAPVQRLEQLGLCQHGHWVVGECPNDAAPAPTRFLCLAHSAGVQITLGQYSGGAFRRRGEVLEDTIFFRDGSSKPSAKGALKNVSVSRVAQLQRNAEERPGDVRALRPGVSYRYGDHWTLSLLDDDADGGTIEVVNDHTELSMRTTFEGRPVTKATPRYPAGSRPTLHLTRVG
jgi:hypothetical protein